MNLRIANCELQLRRLVAQLMFAGACVAVEQLQAQPSNATPTLVPAYTELPPTFWEQHKTIVIIGVLLATALIVLLVWNVFRPKPAPILPPGKIARDALARLQAQPEDGNLLSEVSQILRGYVGAVFQMPGAELTTAEFCAALARNEKIDLQLGESVSSFLRECDVRKFSPAGGAAPVNAANRALEIVARIEQKTHRQDACATTA